MKLKRLAQTAALLLITVPILGCGGFTSTDEYCSLSGYNFECSPDLAKQLKISASGNPVESFTASRKKYGLELITAEFVLYNMNDGQYTEINSTVIRSDRLSQPKDEYQIYIDSDVSVRNFGYYSITDIADPWGLATTTGAECFGIRNVFTYDSGAKFTMLGWRDDSNTTLTAENSIQGVGYMNKNEDFIRSNLIDRNENTANILHQRMVMFLTLEPSNKVSAKVYKDRVTYKDYINFTGKIPLDGGDGDYFADPDPSRCNIINSP